MQAITMAFVAGPPRRLTKHMTIFNPTVNSGRETSPRWHCSAIIRQSSKTGNVDLTRPVVDGVELECSLPSDLHTRSVSPGLGPLSARCTALCYNTSNNRVLSLL